MDVGTCRIICCPEKPNGRYSRGNGHIWAERKTDSASVEIRAGSFSMSTNMKVPEPRTKA